MIRPVSREVFNAMSSRRLDRIEHTLGDAKRERSAWDSLWRSLAAFVGSVDVLSSDMAARATASGTARQPGVHDTTAINSVEILVSGLHTHLTNFSDRWFEIGVEGMDRTALARDELMALDEISDSLYSFYRVPEANFHRAFDIVYRSLVINGPAVIFQGWDNTKRRLWFQAFAPDRVWFKLDDKGLPNRIWIEHKWDLSHLRSRFPNAELPADATRQPESKWTLMHYVGPREGADPSPFPIRPSLRKPFESVFYIKELSHIVEEGGFDWMPYTVARWAHTDGEVYGRSPAINALADIRMVNAMSRTFIRAAQKTADPPLMVPDDNFIMPLDTKPSGLNFFRQWPPTNQAPIMPMPHGAAPQLGLEIMEQRREAIRRLFYVDRLVRPQKRERQTIQEVQDERSEMLGQLSPIVTNLETSLLGPLVRQSYRLLVREEVIEDTFGAREGEEDRMRVHFVSPASVAQSTVQTAGVQQWVGALTMIAEIAPDVFDNLDADAYAQVLSVLYNVKPRLVRASHEVRALREERARREEEQRQAEVGRDSAAALKDIGQARQAGLV